MDWYRKRIVFAMILTAIATTGCISLHDDTGWEHSGASETHEVQDSSDIFEHRH